MRNTIFRGKRKDNGEWIVGYYCEMFNPATKSGLPLLHIISDLLPFSAEIDPETLGQFTGLRDRKGRAIFEGDILKCNRNKYIEGVVVAEEWNCSCCDGVFGFAIQGDGDLRNFDICDIVGNIHDNPELLKGDEK